MPRSTTHTDAGFCRTSVNSATVHMVRSKLETPVDVMSEIFFTEFSRLQPDVTVLVLPVDPVEPAEPEQDIV